MQPQQASSGMNVLHFSVHIYLREEPRGAPVSLEISDALQIKVNQVPKVSMLRRVLLRGVLKGLCC